MRQILIICVLFFMLIFSVSAKDITITADQGDGRDKYCQGTCSDTDELVFTDAQNSLAYILFDLSALPDNTVVLSAYIYIKFKQNSSELFDFARVYSVNEDWQEDDDMQPSNIFFVGIFNDINCGGLCNDEEGWIGVEGATLVNVINSMLSGSNNGFVIKDAVDNFSVYSSEASEGQPFLYLEYESDCVDLDNDGFMFGDCDTSNDCNDSNYYVNPNATEVCNNVDDDCDGIIDDTGYPCRTCNESDGYICNSSQYCRKEYLDVFDSDVCCPVNCTDKCIEGAIVSCGTDIGECIMGYSVCHDNEWSGCLDEVPPVREICNNKDDNCDNITDNVENFFSCGCFNGSSPTKEIYDGIDNDCDNSIDENTTCFSRGGDSCSEGESCPGIILTGTEVSICCSLPCSSDCVAGQSKSCGVSVGACKEGVIDCVDGKWGECVGSVGPMTEKCNRIDDDCNGIVDNVLDPTKCQCSGGGEPFEELCNQADDDCDGEIDEGCTFISDACSDGIQNFNEKGIDCGSSCAECASETVEDDVLNKDNDSLNEGNMIEDSSGSASGSVSSKSRIILYILVSIVLIVVGLVVYIMIGQNKARKGNTTSRQTKKPFKNNDFFSPNTGTAFKTPQRKIGRYDAILRMKPGMDKRAKQIKSRINEKF